MKKTICIFGDSITWGLWDHQRGGWVARLRSYFETNNFETNNIETNNIEVNVYNCGVCGDSTDDLLQRFKVEATARKANIIIFAIGINDSQYINSKDHPCVPIEKLQNNLQELINQAKKITNKL